MRGEFTLGLPSATVNRWFAWRRAEKKSTYGRRFVRDIVRAPTLTGTDVMPELKVVGEGPIVFFTAAGQQRAIPLSAITIDGTTVKVDGVRPTDTGLEKWLLYLIAQGRLTAAAEPAAPAAMLVTAAVPGAAGNNVVVKVTANAVDATKLDVEVTETDVYERLVAHDPTAERYVTTVLGDNANVRGTRPGLVRVDAATPVAAPIARDATADGGGNQPMFKLARDAAGAVAFRLEARAADAEAPPGLWRITVGALDAAEQTFTLTVVWTKTVTVGPAASQLGDLAKLGFGARFAGVGTSPLKLPALGATALTGGAQATDAKSATATLRAKV